MKYIDRNGKVMNQETGQDRLLDWMYHHRLGRMALRPLVSQAASKLGGALLSTPLSARLIPGFIKRAGIDMSQYEKPSWKLYGSFGQFFSRKIREELRPVDPCPEVAVSPCDGKLSVYPLDKNSRFTIKGTPYTVASLLEFPRLAKHYRGGCICIFRLSVDDYHRYCYPVGGKKSFQLAIKGKFYTVNPVVHDVCPVYHKNAREYCLVDSRDFGTVVVMEVGATLVGKINNYHPGMCMVHKGMEKGRFEFGGSTIVLIFQKGRIILDQDLLDNTKNGYETLVKFGERIGIAPDSLRMGQ